MPFTQQQREETKTQSNIQQSQTTQFQLPQLCQDQQSSSGSQNYFKDEQKKKDYELELLLRAHQRIRQLQQQNTKYSTNLKSAQSQIQQLSKKLKEKDKSCQLMKRLNEQLIQNLMTTQEQLKLFKKKFKSHQNKIQNYIQQKQTQAKESVTLLKGQLRSSLRQSRQDGSSTQLKISESTPNLQKIYLNHCDQEKNFLRRQKQQFAKQIQNMQNASKQINDSFSFASKTFYHSSKNDLREGSIYNSKFENVHKTKSRDKKYSSFIKFSQQQFQKNQKVLRNKSPLIKKNRYSQHKESKQNDSLIYYKQKGKQNTKKNEIPKGLFKSSLLNNAKSVSELLDIQKKLIQTGNKLKLKDPKGSYQQNAPYFVNHCRKAKIFQNDSYGLKYRNLYL